jgi:hypothetical protein
MVVPEVVVLFDRVWVLLLAQECLDKETLVEQVLL